MRPSRSSRLCTFGIKALVLLLPLAPVLAVAALATYDLAGMPRATPKPTMGALEASDGLAPPRGLKVTVHRL